MSYIIILIVSVLSVVCLLAVGGRMNDMGDQ